MLKVGLGSEAGTGVEPESGQATGPHQHLTPDVSKLAELFPQLEIIECLGRGGMGVVYKARQPKLDRWVALKILAPEKEDSPGFAARFSREARALARLSHSHIVAVHDFGQIDRLYYLVMEYVDGVSLRQLLRTRGLSPAEALAIVPPICEALQYAHQRGIVHRDIKPENILLDKQGRVKIADFGVARILDPGGKAEALTGASAVVGTPHYMAPEQVERPSSVDHRADIYSLGVVLYEMLTGELPLGRFPPPSDKPDVDARLDQVVLRALEKAPERRYQQASEVKTEVETIAQTKPAPLPESGAASSSPGVKVGPPVAPRQSTSRVSPIAPGTLRRTPARVGTKALAFVAVCVVVVATVFVLRSLHPRRKSPHLPQASAHSQAPTSSPGPIDLLQRYPTRLTSGDADPARARPWEFSPADLFSLSGFKFTIGPELRVESGAAELGVGHCTDGALWALLIPKAPGALISQASPSQERVERVWLRFHPKEINRLIPPETVLAAGASNRFAEMRIVAAFKINSSWHRDDGCLIPDPNRVSVDIDTIDGPRRFFGADLESQTAEYVPGFEPRRLNSPPVITPALAERAFERLWITFDTSYPMFAVRPELDWIRLRKQYLPRALAAASTYEFAGICAEMLSQFHDPEVELTLAGAEVPVFWTPRRANGNLPAYGPLLGLPPSRREVDWTVTGDNIGFLAIHRWRGTVAKDCDAALERMRGTRGLVVDVRWNPGGNEALAREVAGRFLNAPFIYLLSRVRLADAPSGLSSESRRSAAPRGPWRYDPPVLLLIGPACMGANESFIAMMTGAPNVTTIGQPTAGADGLPQTVELPLGMTVTVPEAIVYLPNGACVSQRGILPQIEFKASPGAFQGGRDGLLRAALDRLRQAPLPKSPVGGDPRPAEQSKPPQENHK
jgi:serine/threonine protein kinase